MMKKKSFDLSFDINICGFYLHGRCTILQLSNETVCEAPPQNIVKIASCDINRCTSDTADTPLYNYY